MKNKLIVYLLLSCTLFLLTNSGKVISAPVTLVQDGKPTAVIVISHEASPSEIHGAKELQMFLQMISGAFLPMYQDNESFQGTMVFVGNSTKLQEVAKDIKFADLGDEGFIIKTVGSNLILAGGRLRGSMYAVYTFLEEKLGCRWYTSMVSKIPRMSTIAVEEINAIQKPDFEYREPYWKDAFDGDWAARNKCNSSSAALDVQRGGKINWPGVHTFYPMMPPAVWFDSHPEYFSFREGKRRWEYAQFCLTNPEVMKVMTQKVLNKMTAQPDDILFEVSQNDWEGWCECKDCKVIDAREEAHSGTMIPFVNAIAERTGKVYPKKFVTTLAYAYTEKAPKYAKPRYNVIIRLCNIVGCGSHPLETCEQNERFRQSMAGWAPKTPKMHVWDYVTDFSHYLLPYPNLIGVQADIPWMLKNGVDGLFEQGCYTTKCGAFAELQAYIQAKMLWNTKRDMYELVDDFLGGYFGRAAVPIRAYIDMLHKKVKDENIHFYLGAQPYEPFLSRDILEKADFYFDEAERLADNPDIAHRIAQWRLSLRYAKLARSITHGIEGDLYKPIPAEQKYADLDELEKFIQDCMNHGVQELSERGGYENRYNFLRANVSTHRILTLENPLIKVQVVPGMGGRVLQISYKKTGRDLLAQGDVQESNYPGNAGYQEGPAGLEFFEHAFEKTDNGQKLVMTGYLPGGVTHNAMHMTREIFIPNDKPEIEFSITLKGMGTVDYPRRISASPSFSLGKVKDIQVGMSDGSGSYKLLTLPEPDERGRRGARYWGKSITAGSWCIVNSSENVGIIDTFNPDELDVCSFGVNPEKNRVMLSLDGKQIPIKEGDVLKLHHKYTIVENVNGMIK